MESMYLPICLISIEKKFRFLCLISLPFTAAIKPSTNKIVHFVFHCVASMKTLQFPGFISLSDGKLNNTVLLASNWLWYMVSGWIDFSRWTQMWCLSSWIKRFFSRFTTTLPSIKLIWNTFLKLKYKIQKQNATLNMRREYSLPYEKNSKHFLWLLERWKRYSRWSSIDYATFLLSISTAHWQ